MKILALMIITAVIFFLLIIAIALCVSLGIVLGYATLGKKEKQNG